MLTMAGPKTVGARAARIARVFNKVVDVTTENDYNQQYYEANGQMDDRPALRWYANLAKHYLGSGAALDIGCGTGHLLKRLAAGGEHADGLEASAFSAATARRTSPGSTIYTDPATLPTGRYSRFTAIHVVEHMDDTALRKLLVELRRASRDGASYLIVTPDLGGRARALRGSTWNAYRDPTHINLKTHLEWRSFFVAEGFEVVREGSDGLWNVPYSALPKLLDGIRHAIPMAAQFLSGRLFLRPGTGESSLFIVR